MEILKTLWKPVPVPSCPYSHVQFKLFFYILCPFPLLLLWTFLDSGSIFPKLNSAVRFSHNLILSRLKNPFLSFSSLIHHVLQHLNHFSGPSLDFFQSVNVSVSFVLRDPRVDTAFQMGPPECEVDELPLTLSLQLLALFLLMQPNMR